MFDGFGFPLNPRPLALGSPPEISNLWPAGIRNWIQQHGSEVGIERVGQSPQLRRRG